MSSILMALQGDRQRGDRPTFTPAVGGDDRRGLKEGGEVVGSVQGGGGDESRSEAEKAVRVRSAIQIQAVYRGHKSRRVPLFVLAASTRSGTPGSGARGGWRATAKVLALSLAKLTGYLLLGGLVYGYCEPDFGQDVPTTGIDAVYFSVATMSTVGYGDLGPTSSGMRAFTLFMIYFGIVFIFSDVSGVFGQFTAPVTAAGRRFMERLFPQEGVDLTGDGTPDYYKPRPPSIYYSKNLLPSFLLNMVLQLVSAAIFVAIEPEWTFGDAIYHCLVTASTVGYGDQFIATQGGRLFACFHILASVVLLGELIATADELRMARADTLRRVSQLQRKLDENMLTSLLQRAMSLRPKVERDGKGLTELEFLITMLMELDVVDEGVMKPFIKQFRTLDLTGEGRVGMQDLRLAQSLSKEELGELRKKHAGRASTLGANLSTRKSAASEELQHKEDDRLDA
jgi:potassium channel subfamily K